MSRHQRASHTDNQCYWRCLVATCRMWFSSELNGKDHLERIHKFREGRGYSFYDCLHQFGLEWFGRRSFFEEREVTGQALWMEHALARRSGQELHNHYVITNSPVMAHLRRFFRIAVRDLTAAYEGLAIAHAEVDIHPSICNRDLAVARRNVADFTSYLDLHSAHLAACAGAMDDTVPLMSAETFPRTSDNIRSALDEARRDQ